MAPPSPQGSPEEGLHPALQALIGELDPEAVVGQVRIAKEDEGFVLAHQEDAPGPADGLSPLSLRQLRETALRDSSGRFRPLRSSPDLRRGWIFHARSSRQLGRALEVLYPGCLGDWQAGGSPVPYREFARRQTGMYRIAARLDDSAALETAKACCHSSHCLKKRLWKASSEEERPARPEKVELVCREPCALLLELARRRRRLDQEEQAAFSIPRSERETLLRALEHWERAPGRRIRAADFSQAEAPRRIRLLRERIRAAGDQEPGTGPPPLAR